MADGIADLSYRHYSEGMGKASGAWKVICRDTVKRAFKNKAYWVLTAVSGWSYFAVLAFLYFTEQALQSQLAGGRGGGINPMKDVFDRIVWGDMFYSGFNAGHLLLFITSLIVGVGVIANDNRANALLVYLSRPCTRTTYLFGKWLGVFIALFVSALLPSLVFWMYGAMNYRPYGFLADDPWLVLKVIAIAGVNAAILSSLAVGFSSLFRQPRLAGATLAGIYFVSYFTTMLFRIALVGGDNLPKAVRAMAEQFSYFSINGMMQGASKVILNTNGSAQFGFMNSGGRGGAGNAIIPKPEAWIMFGVIGLVLAAAYLIASTRIRAVEVVK